MIDFITALWLGFIGACIGSFLNVVAYRMPLGMSVVWKPSHCPKCEHSIRARDNVPVLGWLMLRGRCRDCGEPISPRYAIVELVMGLAFFVLTYVELFGGGTNLLGFSIFPAQYSFSITMFSSGEVAELWEFYKILILLYLYHCTLLSVLMCAVLIDAAGDTVPWKVWLFGLTSAVGLAWNQDFFQQFMVTGWWINTRLSSRFGLLCMIGALYVLSGSILIRITLRCVETKQSNRVKNHIGALCMTGIFLGPTLFAMALPIAIVFSFLFMLLQSRIEWIRNCGPLSPLFIAVLLLLCKWW